MKYRQSVVLAAAFVAGVCLHPAGAFASADDSVEPMHLAALSPEQREQMRQQMREHWRQLPPEQRQEQRREWRERRQQMSPEERQQAREAWQQRREQFGNGPDNGGGGPGGPGGGHPRRGW